MGAKVIINFEKRMPIMINRRLKGSFFSSLLFDLYAFYFIVFLAFYFTKLQNA